MPAPPVCALLLSSPDAAGLKRWYSTAFDVNENNLGALEFGSVDLYIEDHSEITGPTKEPARIMVCLNVEDFTATEQRLRAFGVQWVRNTEETSFGMLATICDPDGNFLQLTQWKVPSADRRS
jgi:predicted enzyme related to lactoylglutathione lyase